MFKFLIVLLCFCELHADCNISLNADLRNPQPLLLNPRREGRSKLLMPDYKDIITLSSGQLIETHCLGHALRIENNSKGVQNLNFRCILNKLFRPQEKITNINSITCSRYPVHTARLTGNFCFGQHLEFEIGFEVDEIFLTTLSGCFDPVYQTTLYTVIQLNYLISGRQTTVPRPGWAHGNFYTLENVALNTLYTRNRQRITINSLLGLEANSTKYIHESNNFYLARGHLSARADFVLGNQQRSTFYFINAAPKWQNFNGGNWNILEENIRQFVIENHLNITVYTGTFGVSTLPHEETGEDIALYLYVDENQNKAIPVPELFWKVIYDPISKNGTAFVGLNNPYVKKENVQNYSICPDVCSEISWIRWTPSILTRGYAYCCTIQEFRKVVKSLPYFETISLLK